MILDLLAGPCRSHTWAPRHSSSDAGELWPLLVFGRIGVDAIGRGVGLGKEACFNLECAAVNLIGATKEEML